jgi:hypothetical protein
MQKVFKGGDMKYIGFWLKINVPKGKYGML